MTRAHAFGVTCLLFAFFFTLGSSYYVGMGHARFDQHETKLSVGDIYEIVEQPPGTYFIKTPRGDTLLYRLDFDGKAPDRFIIGNDSVRYLPFPQR